MAAKTKTMEQIRKMLQMRARGVSIRAITKQEGIARNTIRAYLRLIESGGYSLTEALALDDSALGELLFEATPKLPSAGRHQRLQEKLPDYVEELKRKHVTRFLLWEEYRQAHPDGYGYTRFCHFINDYIRGRDVTSIFSHRPAEKLMVDFAGDKLHYIDRTTGEQIPCEVFVAALPYSSFIYAEALRSQRQEEFVGALSRAFAYLGGVPGCVVCDNLKSAVKRANRYEPAFTELIGQLSLHYDTSFMAARPGKPRDKATVESSVRTTYSRIYARLRNQAAYSLEELNEQLHMALEDLNNRLRKGRQYSRKDIFLHYEQPLLRALPTGVFQVKRSVMAKVQRNYHIILGEDYHQYSVPWRYCAKTVKVVYTADMVEIYCDHKRIALHRRNYRKHGYTTLPEHMPEHHRAVLEQKGWDADYFLRQAAHIGPCTHQVIRQVLESRAFPEQTYNACLGILRLENKYGRARLETASRLLADGPRVNYTLLANILKNNMDKRSAPSAGQDFKTPLHDNIRGPEQFLH